MANMEHKNYPVYKSIFLKAIMSLMAIIVFACQAPYENDQLDASQKIPVINVIYTNTYRACVFEFYYAKPYNQTKTEYITGAQVTIANKNGSTITLVEPTPGVYQLPDSMAVATVGGIYTLTLTTADGITITSEPVTMPDTVEIENVYHVGNNRTYTVKNNYGNYNTITEYGLFTYLRAVNQPDKTLYCRSNADYYVHSQKQKHTEKDHFIIKDNYQYNYKINIDTVFDIYEGYQNTEFQQYKIFNYGTTYSIADMVLNPLFFVADRHCSDFSMFTSNRFIDWVMPVTLYSSAKATFDYYNSVNEQLNAPNRIYDPIPSQIISNLTNVTNPLSPVLGHFDVSATTMRYYRIYVQQTLSGPIYAGKTINYKVYPGKYYKSSRIDTIFVDSVLVTI